MSEGVNETQICSSTVGGAVHQKREKKAAKWSWLGVIILNKLYVHLEPLNNCFT